MTGELNTCAERWAKMSEQERAEAIAADEAFRRRHYPWSFDEDEPPSAEAEDDEA
jgi:hypothetical protein